MEQDIEKWVRQYIEVRDALKQVEDAHKVRTQEIKGALDKLAGRIQNFMNTHNLQNARTAAGTAHISQKSTASLADPDAFMQYVIANQNFDLLDRRANVTAVKAFVEQHKALPPGCNLNTIATVGITRASAKPSSET